MPHILGEWWDSRYSYGPSPISHFMFMFCFLFLCFCFCYKGYWRITKPHWRTCWRWLQKDGNAFWWIEQKPHRHGLHKDVFWRTNCGTSNSHFLLDYAVVPWLTSPWTSCCSLPCHYLCATVKYGRISCCFTFGSHICDWWSYIFHYMKAEKFALFQIVCCFVIKFISGCRFKLNSTLDYNRVEYTFCSLFKSLVLLLWSVPTFKHPTLFPSQILTPPKSEQGKKQDMEFKPGCREFQ